MESKIHAHVGKNYPVEITSTSCHGDTNGEFEIDLDIDSTIVYSLSDGTNSNSFSSNGNPLQISGLSAGNYSVEIPSLMNICDLQQFNFEIVQPENIAASSTVNDELNGMDGSINLTVSGGTAPYLFTWSNGAITEDLTNLTEGNYLVLITDFNGCQFTQDIFVGSSVGLEDDESEVKFILIPALNIIQVYGNEQQYKLYSISGQEINVRQNAISDSYCEIKIPSNLSAGTYILSSGNSIFRFVIE
ncbi:MAG: SprB repeat-containing protein [Crocinitomicaceae bacterium]|nr:SprB repeat-containing protein [Crocinitomicaceae bacterium]